MLTKEEIDYFEKKAKSDDELSGEDYIELIAHIRQQDEHIKILEGLIYVGKEGRDQEQDAALAEAREIILMWANYLNNPHALTWLADHPAPSTPSK